MGNASFLIFKVYKLATYKNDLKWETAHYKYALKPKSKITSRV